MIDKENFDRIFSTLNTITTQINKDLYKLKTKEFQR